MESFRVLFTGGGTGGHINPIVAVVGELQSEALRQNKRVKIVYAGSASKKYRTILKDNGVKVKSVLGTKLRRYFSWLHFIEIPKFLISILQSLWILFWFMPDVVFSKGGPGSMPVVLTARFYRIPVVVHESDSVLSITSKFTGRFAKVIAVSFNSSIKYLEGYKGKVIMTGNPIRPSLLRDVMPSEQAKAFLGFDKNLPLILVLGGSQGAQILNEFVTDNLPQFLEFSQVFHQTGEKNYEAVGKGFSLVKNEIPENLISRYKVIDFFEEDIRIALSACDVVLSRAGASAIFEIAAFRKPSILVPIAGSANNHQLLNAVEYAKTGASFVIEENNLLPHLFFDRVKELFSDPNKLTEMSKATANFYMPDSALKLAQILLTINEQ